MAFTISAGARTAACDSIVDRLDAGSAAGYIQIRTGSAPATPATANSGTLLATLTFTDPAFGAAATGVAIASAIASDSSADASGDAGHFRLFDSDGNCEAQGTCDDAGSPDMLFDEKTIVAGGVVAITSMTITVPAA